MSWSYNNTVRQKGAGLATDSIRDRNSDVRVEPKESHAVQPRFSDYEYAPDWDAERESTGVVYDQADVRVSATSDRLLRRGRVNANSNNRLSSIYGGHLSSWASDCRQNNIHTSIILEDLEVQEDEVTRAAHATALKLAALSTINDRVVQDGARNNSRTRSNEPWPKSQSSAPADLQAHDEASISTIVNNQGHIPAYKTDVEVGELFSARNDPSTSHARSELTGIAAQPDSDALCQSAEGVISGIRWDDVSSAVMLQRLGVGNSSSLLEIFLKAFGVSEEDPCSKVLPVIFSVYKIPVASQHRYAIHISYTSHGQRHGRQLHSGEKPLAMIKMMQQGGRKPQLMLRKLDDTVVCEVSPKGNEETYGVPSPSIQSNQKKFTSALFAPKASPTPGTSPSLKFWRAVSISTSRYDSDTTFEGRKWHRYKPGDVFDVLDISYTQFDRQDKWLATPQGGSSRDLGWIASSDFLTAPTLSKTASHDQLSSFPVTKNMDLVLDIARVCHIESRTRGHPLQASTLLIMGRLKQVVDSDTLGGGSSSVESFRVIARKDPSQNPRQHLVVEPSHKRSSVLLGLEAHADGVLSLIENTQSKAARSMWNDLGEWLQLVPM